MSCGRRGRAWVGQPLHEPVLRVGGQGRVHHPGTQRRQPLCIVLGTGAVLPHPQRQVRDPQGQLTGDLGVHGGACDEAKSGRGLAWVWSLLFYFIAN